MQCCTWWCRDLHALCRKSSAGTIDGYFGDRDKRTSTWAAEAIMFVYLMTSISLPVFICRDKYTLSHHVTI